MSKITPSVVVLGGGTGSFTLLKDLKNLPIQLTALVNMSDDGGSSGDLRDELGVLPPGDIRQCLIALSDNPEVRTLFDYRFGEGRYKGQSLGNIILSGLELMNGSFEEAVNICARLLNLRGQVIPISLDEHDLVMQDGDQMIVGEYLVGHHKIKHPNPSLKLEPRAEINKNAKKALKNADVILIAPGSLYGSLLPIFLVDGVCKTISSAKAVKVSVANLINKPGQTDGWHVVDYIKQFEKYLGEGALDIVLYNSEPISKNLLRKYASENETPVLIDASRFGEIKAQAIGARLISPEITVQDPNDTAIRRTLIRHDGMAVGRELMQVINNLKSKS